MATPAAQGAELFGGATPFGWASLGIGALGASGAAAKAASAAPGMSSADLMFGPVTHNFDTSNWQINSGNGTNQSMEVGPKTGPTTTPSMTWDKVQSQASYPATSGAAYPSYGAGYGTGSGAQYQQPIATQAGSIPTSWLLIGLAVVLLWKKS